MSDTKKLSKRVDKAHEAVALRRTELDEAIRRYAEAIGERDVALDHLDQAEALEAARELRGKR